jgi:hypothetical protein
MNIMSINFDPNSLFNVDSLVAIVTGGGTGMC